MANLRFARSSQNLAVLGTVQNGVGTNAPALQEDSQYPMSNAAQADRYTPWKTPGTPPSSPLNIDIDLGAAFSIYAIGVHRYNLLGGSAGTLTVQTQTGSYNGTGTWTTFGTIASANLTSSKDRCVIDTNTVASVRSIRWSFAHTSGIWSVGKLFAIITPTVDLGNSYAVGSVLTPVRYQTVQVDANGIPDIDDHNEDGFLWSLDLGYTTSAIRLSMWTLVNSGAPVSMIDENDKLEEVRVVGGQIATEHTFLSVYHPRLELARLP